MSSQNSSGAAVSGIGFTGLLTIVFITLKLLNAIDWSWWWVLSPIWISTAISVVLAILIICLISIDKHLKDKDDIDNTEDIGEK